MGYGERDLVRGAGGEDVVELQMRLAGFRGTVPDGGFGPGTELQVTSFQRDWMERGQPEIPRAERHRPDLGALRRALLRPRLPERELLRAELGRAEPRGRGLTGPSDTAAV